MKDIPAFKFLVYMIAGITLSFLLKLFEINFYYLFPVSFAVIIALYFLKLKEISYILACVFTGILVTVNIYNQQLKVPDNLIPEQNAVFIGSISSVNRLDSNYVKIIVNGTLDTKVLPKLENQSITLNIYNINEIKVKLIPGTKIYAKLKVRLPRPKIFPTDFDEKQFYSSSEINFIGKAYAKDISLIDGPNLFQYTIYKFTNELKHRIDVIFGSKNSGIIKALLTGDQTQINADIRQNFSVTGTVHVLSVGGLHVGLISIAIYLLLSFITNRWVKFVIFSILIFLFIVITGYQASALRAGVMAILLILASNMERKTNPVNIISCVSIFIILFDNAIILSPSFQMSITSVLGILLLYKPIYEKFRLFFKTENSIVNFILTSFAVSISASTIVSPIVAYYFGVYSIISPIANLFVIPLFSIASYMSIIALVFSEISMNLGIIFGNSANFLIDVSNYINELSAETNLSYISGNNTLLISLLISISVIYLSLAQSKR
jgi:competence protein ComEC